MYNSSVLSLSEARFFYLPSKKRIFAQNYYIVIFKDLQLNTPLHNALDDLGFTTPTPIQEQAFGVILSGKDMVGIAQTGTGKTFAYMLPLLRELKFSKQQNPRIVILVPTRELVVQVVDEIEKLAAYINVRVGGVYGGVSMSSQTSIITQGLDILVGTPGRLYDFAINNVLKLKSVQKLVIDEVDVMLNIGFRFQLVNIFDLLPERRQNILFSATMTTEIDALIDDFFLMPERVTIAASGTPLENILQYRYKVKNFYTKINLLAHLVEDKTAYSKVLVFAGSKRLADIVFEKMDEQYPGQCAVIHSNKTQNYRLRSVEDFEQGKRRILIATDVMARGLDISRITHVFNIDTPEYPENYMHRIGRTGRATEQGVSFVFTTEAENDRISAIEELMNQEVQIMPFPDEVRVESQLLEEERPQVKEHYNPIKLTEEDTPGPAFHEKKTKNQKVNLGGSYKRKIKEKYKKPKTRGDKKQQKRK